MFVADLHAITETHDARTLAFDTLSTAAIYLACGVDTERTTLFIQSHVPEHAQLARLLGAVTSVGMLKRMIQFKEKSVKQGEDACLALFDYPVLMAADILLYDADRVPVGNDQQQHLQLTRSLAERFNRVYGNNGAVFKLPEPYIVAEAARIMSLTDGTRKMSKSDPNDASRINLLDTPDQIRGKIKRARTDALRGLEFDNPARPEVHNLLCIYQLLSNQTREQVLIECQGLGFGQFKPLLTEAIVTALEPVQKRYTELMSDRQSLSAILRVGRDRAREVAARTLARASSSMGFAAEI